LGNILDQLASRAPLLFLRLDKILGVAGSGRLALVALFHRRGLSNCDVQASQTGQYMKTPGGKQAWAGELLHVEDVSERQRDGFGSRIH
jgi:hypothetical protein